MSSLGKEHFARYLAASTYIDWQHPAVRARAMELSRGGDIFATARQCFEFVRDTILHSGDFRKNPVTCRASEVLEYGTGFCYAKSHLLAALLRANGIPAGLCYQRLTIENDQPPYSLHGLNAVYLPEIGWYRIDARGVKPGVDAAFAPPVEKLAFTPMLEQERDLPEIWPEPLPEIILLLTTCTDYQDVLENLPDLALVNQ